MNFPQTLGDLGSRWFGRLPAASISSFGELSKAFSRQFLGNVHRKKSVAHSSQLRQGKDESLKKYLGRFGQEVSEIGSANDEAIIAAFINNLQNGQLSFDLRRARLTSYADMMDMAGGTPWLKRKKLLQEVTSCMAVAQRDPKQKTKQRRPMPKATNRRTKRGMVGMDGEHTTRKQINRGRSSKADIQITPR